MPYQIFLVEDHPAVRGAYVSVLRIEPDFALCGEAASAEEALAQLEGLPCDLVVTDIRLPGMSGIDFVERLREDRPDLPALVITGHEEPMFARRAREAGAAGFLPKRKAARGLVTTIRAVLQATNGAASTSGAGPDDPARAT